MTQGILVRELAPLRSTDLDADMIWLQDNARFLDPSSLPRGLQKCMGEMAWVDLR